MSKTLRGLAFRTITTTTLFTRISKTDFSSALRSAHKAACCLALLLAACAVPWSLQAQDATGKIAGIISDPTGGVIPQAKVTATNVETKIAKSAVTDASGFYQIQPLPIGTYSVSVEAAGFSKMSSAPSHLEINQTMRVDLKLEIGSVSDVVTVDSQSSIIETQNATLSGTVSGVAIAELPLNGRNTLDLLASQPGVTRTNPDSGAAGDYSIGGGRTDSVTYLLDGGLNNNLLSNGVVSNPNPDAVSEFRVLESNYSAEYGRNAGGIVSVVTKSGTNQLHGSAYDFLRNNDLNANSFFNNQQDLARSVLKRNQFGGTLGGPIYIPKVVDGRNKLFFFFSYQGQRQTALDTSQGKVTMFTPAEANGDFSQAVNGGPDPAVVSYLQGNPYYQPNPVLAAQGIIDPSRIDPIAASYFTKGLIPTAAAGFAYPQAPATANNNEYLGRIDYNLSSRDLLSGTFTSSDAPYLYPFRSANVVGYPVTYEDSIYFGNVSWVHTFTPALVNEVRVTAQRINHTQAIPARSLPTPADLGIGITPDQPTGPTRLGFLGQGLNIGFSPQGPTTEANNTYAFSDTLSWTKGKHGLKFGFFFSPYQNNTKYDFYVNGEFDFYGPSTGVGSGNDFADFLMGLPDEYYQFGAAPSNIRTHSYAGFAQDEWKVSRRVTLTAGLRYEYNTPKYDTQGRSFSFIPGLQSTRFENAPPGLVFPGDPGAPKGSNFPDKNNFAPRVGFAWDVFGNAKTSLRGGWGMFYDILKGEDNLQYNGQAPFFGFNDIYFNPSNGQAPINYSQPYTAAGAINTFPSKPPAQNLDFGAAGFLPFGGGGVFFVDPHLKTPYVYQYNVTLQQELAKNLTLELGYLGYTAHGLTSLVDINPFIIGAGYRMLNTPDVTNFSYLEEFRNVSNANYNAFETNLTKRISSGENPWLAGTFFTLAYTYSHEIDNASGFRQRNSNVPYYNPEYFRASGDTDLRHVVAFSGGWQLPFDQLWQSGPKLLTKGWAVYPIISYQTGFPLDVFADYFTSRGSPGPSGAGDGGIVRANLVGSSVGILNARQFQTIGGNPGNYYFNPGNFVSPNNDPNNLTYGSFPRNGLRGPRFFNVNMSVVKQFYIGERFNLELRADMFNMFNNVQFQNPDVTISDATFGQISTTYDPRIIQLALHLKF